MINVRFVTVPLVKVREHLRLRGQVLEVKMGKKIMSTGLPLAIFFQKRGRGLNLLVVCAVKRRNTLAVLTII